MPSLPTQALRWSAAGFAASGLLGLLTAGMLARLLHAADFGLVGLALLPVGLALLVGDLGLTPAVVAPRAVAARQDATRSPPHAPGGSVPSDALPAAVFALQVAAGALLALALWAAAGALAAAFGEPRLAALVRAEALLCVLRAPGVVPRALLQRQLRFRAHAAADVLGAATRLVVAVGVAHAGAGPWSLVAGDLAGQAAQTLTVLGLARWRPRGPLPGREALEALAGFAAPMLAANLVVWTRGRLDRLLVGLLLGPAALGHYQLAARLAGLPVEAVTHVAARVLLPVYARCEGTAAVRRRYRGALGGIALVTMPLCLGLAAVAPAAVTTIYGPGWAPVVAPLRLLALAGLVSAVSATTGEVFKAVGRPGHMLRTALPHLALLALALFAGAPGGVLAIAAAVLVTRIVIGGAALLLLARTIGLSLRRLVATVAPSATAAALMAALVTAAVAVPPAPAPPVVVLGLQVAAGAAAYAVALTLLLPGSGSLAARLRRVLA